MDRDQMIKAFNEWMRRYTEDPEGFYAEFRTVIEFLEDENSGREPSYGESCADNILMLSEEINAAIRI